MCNDASNKVDHDELKERLVALRTRATTRQVLLVLYHLTLTGNWTVLELRNLLDQMAADPQEGVRFILRFDDSLRSRLESERSVIVETFIKEINESIDTFSTEKEKDMLDQLTQMGNDFSRLYGKDSAWN